jgi:hypothetical protein
MLNVTQTGVVMSKTVKRVMTVTMFGLVALLGAKAEAHTVIIKGTPRVCSVCSDAKDNLFEEVLNDPNLANSLAIAELTVKTKLVTILCDNTEVQLKNVWTLKNEAPLAGWDPNTKTAHANFFVSVQPFVDFVLDQGLCIEPPKVVLIRRMDAVYRAYECFGSAPDQCSSKVLVSKMKLDDCKVPPNAQPPTPYDCKKPQFEHPL